MRLILLTTMGLAAGLHGTNGTNEQPKTHLQQIIDQQAGQQTQQQSQTGENQTDQTQQDQASSDSQNVQNTSLFGDIFATGATGLGAGAAWFAGQYYYLHPQTASDHGRKVVNAIGTYVNQNTIRQVSQDKRFRWGAPLVAAGVAGFDVYRNPEWYSGVVSSGWNSCKNACSYIAGFFSRGQGSQEKDKTTQNDNYIIEDDDNGENTQSTHDYKSDEQGNNQQQDTKNNNEENQDTITIEDVTNNNDVNGQASNGQNNQDVRQQENNDDNVSSAYNERQQELYTKLQKSSDINRRHWAGVAPLLQEEYQRVILDFAYHEYGAEGRDNIQHDIQNAGYNALCQQLYNCHMDKKHKKLYKACKNRKLYLAEGYQEIIDKIEQQQA